MPIRLTQVVKIFLIVYFSAFVIQQTGDHFLGTQLMGVFAFVPALFLKHFYVWQLFTYSFMHTDVMHLFFNGMMLAFIGSEIESTWGSARFLRYYFFCSTASALVYLLFQWGLMRGSGLYTPMIGASGPIYGLLMAYGLIFGERVLLFMMLFPMKAKHFIWVLAGLELMTTLYSSGGVGPGIAQLSGMGAGFIYLWVRVNWILAEKKRRSLGFPQGRVSKKRRSQHLKLVVPDPQEFETSSQDSESGPKTWH